MSDDKVVVRNLTNGNILVYWRWVEILVAKRLGSWEAKDGEGIVYASMHNKRDALREAKAFVQAKKKAYEDRREANG